MAPEAPPTLFLIHGGGHGDPAYFQKFQDELHKAEIPTETGTQPSNGGFPPRPMYNDAAYWRAEIDRLADAGKDVVVLMHSVGGVVGTEATQGLGKAERAKRGLPGGVVHLVYLTAYLPNEGDSVFSFYGEGTLLPTRAEFRTADNGVDIFVLDPFAAYYYNDMAPEEQQHWAQYLKHSPLELITQPVTHATWQDIPTSYIIAELDQVILPEVQQQMVNDAKEKHGIEITTFSLPSSHSPFLSMPDRLTDVIKSIYRAIQK